MKMNNELLNTNSDKYLKRLVREIQGVVMGGGQAFGCRVSDGNTTRFFCARLITSKNPEKQSEIWAIEVSTGKHIHIDHTKPIIDHRGQDIIASREQ
jgi:hypothetical protein